jgi:DNA primase
MPKYINSPDTDLFDKGQTLFGLHLAKAAIAKEDRAIVVEGYFDVIALHSQGITNVVASQGTALGKHQVRQLLRHTESNRLVLNFDADTAGSNAAERAIGEVESLAQQGLVDLRILSLAGHKDADEYLAAQGPGIYQSAILKAPLWLEWQIDRLISGLDLSDGASYRTASVAISSKLSAVTDAATRSHYCHRYAEQLAKGNPRLAIQLEADLQRNLRAPLAVAHRTQPAVAQSTPRDSAELQLLKIYLHCPSQRINLDRMFVEASFTFQNHNHQTIWGIFGEVSKLHPDSDWGLIIGSYLVDTEPEVFGIAKGVINLTEAGRINTCNNPAFVAQGALATIARLEARKLRSEYLAELANQPIASVEDCVGLAIEQGGEDAIVLAQKTLNAGAYRCQNLISQQDALIREAEMKRRARFVF